MRSLFVVLAAVVALTAGCQRAMEYESFRWEDHGNDGKVMVHFIGKDRQEYADQAYGLDMVLGMAGKYGWEYAGAVGNEVIMKRRRQDGGRFYVTFEKREMGK